MTKKTLIQIGLAWLFHIILIIAAFLQLQDNYDAFCATVLISYAIYLIYWVVSNLKSYMPWFVFVNFLIGAAVEIVLNFTGVIPPDSAYFSGLTQFLYIISILLYCFLLAITNGIMHIVYRARNKKTAPKQKG